MTVPTALRDLLRTVVAGRDPAPAPASPNARFPRVRVILPVLATALALGLAATAIADLPGMKEWQDAPGWLAVPAGLASALPVLLVQRRLSLLALHVCWLVALVSAYYGPLFTSPWPANPVAIFTFLFTLLVVGYRHEPRVLIWAWAGSGVMIWLFCVRSNTVGGLLLISAVLLIGYLAGRWRRAKHELAAAQERGVVLTERARIARELHDVVAHHMSLIAVRAETAPYRLGDLPASARVEFAEISQASRESLAEMRRLLGVLRSEGERPATEPQPGVADLPALVEAARAAGTPVSVEVCGELDNLPAAVQLSAYRIVQESLSNAARHATGAAVQVSLHGTGNDLVLRISNAAGAPAPPGSSVGSGSTPMEPAAMPAGPIPQASSGGSQPALSVGHGVRGMRERATALGGQLAAHPTEDGGFEVRATLPVIASITGRDGAEPIEGGE